MSCSSAHTVTPAPTTCRASSNRGWWSTECCVTSTFTAYAVPAAQDPAMFRRAAPVPLGAPAGSAARQSRHIVAVHERGRQCHRARERMIAPDHGPAGIDTGQRRHPVQHVPSRSGGACPWPRLPHGSRLTKRSASAAKNRVMRRALSVGATRMTGVGTEPGRRLKATAPRMRRGEPSVGSPPSGKERRPPRSP